jgi:hypothetical protein
MRSTAALISPDDLREPRKLVSDVALELEGFADFSSTASERDHDGFGGAASNWIELAPELARDHRVVVCDLPGHGGSSPLPALRVAQRRVITKGNGRRV